LLPFVAVVSLCPRASADGDRRVSAGYHEESRPRTGLVIAGAATFGAAYLLAVLTAAAYTCELDPMMPSSCGGPDARLYIPFAGPFLQMSTSSVSTFGNVLFATNGLAQVAGAGMFTLGLAWHETRLVRDVPVSFRLAPLRLGASGMGIGLSGEL
jgi:hypothetical protein